MSSRKRRCVTNPLSQARGPQQGSEQIWFRRTGAGYLLFGEYYSRQPDGTVVSFADAREHVVVPEKKNSSGPGMSRASKRRKKKKNKNRRTAITQEAATVPLQGVESSEPAVPQTNDGSSVTVETAVSLPSSPLLQLVNAKNMVWLRPFLEAMSRPLPLTFRLRRSRADDTLQSIRNQLATPPFSDHVQPLSWNADIYQAHCLQKSNLSTVCPALKEFLVKHSQDGTLARQELGSMLPVLALEQSGLLPKHSRVLDLCASPGSKTLQVMELLGDKGRLVANDVSPSRSTALQQAVARSGMNTHNCLSFSTLDATQLTVPAGKPRPNVILADVPCSGDGTIRKDPCLLRMWQPKQGHQLHALQLQILIRALELVEPGGAVCYSTCSLNPAEDEAVVAAAMRHVVRDNDDDNKPPRVELVEWKAPLGFCGRPGIRDWKVAEYHEQTGNNEDEDDETVRLTWYDTWEEAVEGGMRRPCASLWPHASNKDIPLKKCMRLWPHDQDSGGFFLALFRKNW